MTVARATDAVLCRRYVGYRRRLVQAEHDQALPRRFRSDNKALQAACVLSVEDRGRTNESRATADDHGSVQFCSKADDNRCRAGPRSDPSLPHATNETVPSLWPDRGVAAQLLLRGPRAARADPLLSRYEAPSSFVWESSTKDHRFRRRSRLLSIATISPPRETYAGITSSDVWRQASLCRPGRPTSTVSVLFSITCGLF